MICWSESQLPGIVKYSLENLAHLNQICENDLKDWSLLSFEGSLNARWKTFNGNLNLEDFNPNYRSRNPKGGEN